jgi:hypothetical protein
MHILAWLTHSQAKDFYAMADVLHAVLPIKGAGYRDLQKAALEVSNFFARRKKPNAQVSPLDSSQSKSDQKTDFTTHVNTIIVHPQESSSGYLDTVQYCTVHSVITVVIDVCCPMTSYFNIFHLDG